MASWRRRRHLECFFILPDISFWSLLLSRLQFSPKVVGVVVGSREWGVWVHRVIFLFFCGFVCTSDCTWCVCAPTHTHTHTLAISSSLCARPLFLFEEKEEWAHFLAVLLVSYLACHSYFLSRFITCANHLSTYFLLHFRERNVDEVFNMFDAAQNSQLKLKLFILHTQNYTA